jgi:hypothetical protein
VIARLADAIERAFAVANDAAAARGWLMALDPRLRAAFDAEYDAAVAAFAADEVARAVEHIGRAHILGSHFWSTHLRAHWLMLRIGLRRADPYEIWIQALRTTGTFGTRLLAPFFGTTGNPGMAEFGAGARFDLPDDLARLIALQSFTRWHLPWSRARSA